MQNVGFTHNRNTAIIYIKGTKKALLVRYSKFEQINPLELASYIEDENMIEDAVIDEIYIEPTGNRLVVHMSSETAQKRVILMFQVIQMVLSRYVIYPYRFNPMNALKQQFEHDYDEKCVLSRISSLLFKGFKFNHSHVGILLFCKKEVDNKARIDLFYNSKSIALKVDP
jgi:hypothetical protein